MQKISILFLSFSLFALGMSYENFKKHTLKNAKTLKAKALTIHSTQETNNILLRSKNPTLSLEASRYNPKGTNSTYHYAGTVSQTIRTDSYYRGLQNKTDALNLLQEAYMLEGKAGYIRTLEKLYTQYVYQSKLLSLLKEEYTLSKKVTDIVEQRYKNGSENKVAYLQAKTDSISLKTQLFTSKEALNTLYYQLLAIAGLKRKVTLEKKFIYPISTHTASHTKVNPKQQILKAKEKLLESQITMNQSTIERYDVYTSIADEPDQSIFRVGIAMDIPIFNNKSEEKMLAKLQKEQLRLQSEQLDIDIHTQTQMIQSSISTLYSQYLTLKHLKEEQKVLSDLLQEGYEISQGSLFVMMSAKNKLIQTQKSLLQTQKLINTQKIDLRFIQGAYND